MEIQYQTFSPEQLTEFKPSTKKVEQLLPGEIDGVVTELILMKGPAEMQEPGHSGLFDVLLTLDGEASVLMSSGEYRSGTPSVIRLPYRRGYGIRVNGDREFCCLRIRKSLDRTDREFIDRQQGNYNSHYAQPLSECKTYTEDIKSEKTVNRMILTEGNVPRLVIGSVKTEGPDRVEAHQHPMLDQLFLGLEGCHCTIHADGARVVLQKNTLLHVPLGSKHRAEVGDGNLLSYIWMDFFLTLEGESYISDQHTMEDD